MTWAEPRATTPPALPAPAPAMVPQRVLTLAARSTRTAGAAFVVLLLGAFLGLAAGKSNGFVVGVLAPYAGVLLLFGFGLVFLARRQTAQVRRSAGLAKGDNVGAVLRPYDLQVVPDGLPAVFAALGVIGFGTVMLFTLPVAVAAASLHRPITTTVLGSSVTDSCARCHQGATATFIVDGRTVTAQLAAPGIGEQAPTSVVYDADQPTHAMSAADYAFGSSQTPWRRLAGTLLLGAASLGWGLLLGRSKAQQLRSGRPAVAIRSIALHTPTRGPTRWQVTFADGKKAEYLDSPHQRSLLAQRIAADPGRFTPPPTTAMELLRPVLQAAP